MRKIFTKLIGVTLGLAMAVGVGVGVAANNKKATMLDADAGEKTIAVSDVPNAYSGTSFTSDSVSYGCSNINNTSSSGNIQWKSNSGYLYNTTAINGITSILINSGSTGSFSGTIYTGNDVVDSDSGTSYAVTGGNAVAINGSPSYFRIKAATVSGGAKSGSIVITFDTGSDIPDPITYTGVEVSEKTPLTGTYKGEAYYECQASVTGTGAYSSAVTWSITSTNAYGTGTSIENVASIDANGKIIFLDNVNAIYVWATAADETTHNATGFTVTASGLLDNTIPNWTKITDSDDVSITKVYALSNDGNNYGEASIVSSQISLTDKLSKVGYIILESTNGGYHARFATYENSEWVVDTGKYINWTSSTSISGGATASTVWTLVENSTNGVYLKISGGRHLGIGNGIIKAYADVNANAPAYLWEVDSLPVINCDTIELTGKPSGDMSIGDTATLGYYALGSDGNEWTGDVVYSISNESTSGVVELSATSGLSVTLTAKKAGTARVSVRDRDENADADYVDVTVLADPERIELSTGSYTVVIDASEEESNTLPTSREYEIKPKVGRIWYQNLTVNFTNITVLTNYGEYESAKSNGVLTVTNNSNARISNVEVHYYKFENDGVGVYVNDVILTPTSSTGTSGSDNDLYRGYSNISGNTFALCNKNPDYTSKFYTVTITLTVAEENEEFHSLVIDKGTTATSFTEGDAPNATGLTVYENYTTDGSTISRSENVTASATWNYSIATIGARTKSYTVTATYGGHTSAAVTVDGFTVTPIAKYSLYESAIAEGDYIIYYNGRAMKNTISSNRTTYSDVQPTNDIILTNATDIVWHIARDGDYYTIYNAAVNKYLASTNSNNQAALESDVSDYSRWTVEMEAGKFEFINKARADASSLNKYLRNNTTYGFACYQDSMGGSLSLYRSNIEGYLRRSAVAVSTYTEEASGNILRLGSSIPVETWNSILAVGEITDYGVMIYKTDSEANIASATPVEDAYRDTEVAPAVARKGNGVPPTAVDGNYVFTARMKVSNPDTIFCAASFVVIGGQYYFFNEQHVTASQLAS